MLFFFVFAFINASWQSHVAASSVPSFIIIFLLLSHSGVLFAAVSFRRPFAAASFRTHIDMAINTLKTSSFH